MTIDCTAVYESGTLRLSQPLALPDGAKVKVFVEIPIDNSEPKNLVDRLAAIAAMPLEMDDNGFSGANHDQFLYGEDGSR